MAGWRPQQAERMGKQVPNNDDHHGHQVRDREGEEEDYQRVEPRLEYRTVSSVSGPLIVLDKVRLPKYAETVLVTLRDGAGQRRGLVLEVAGDRAVVMMLDGTDGIDTSSGTRVECTGDVFRLPVSREMVGRVFNGSGRPIDRCPEVLAEDLLDIQGQPINPVMIDYAEWMIETGISAIDVMNSLSIGSRLPIISSPGLPHHEIAAQICRQARLSETAEGYRDYLNRDDDDRKQQLDEFVVVFAAMGVSVETARFFKNDFEETGNMGKVIMFLNLAGESITERIITPRVALTAAEYLAFRCNQHVLVILTDMTAYGQALCEVAVMRGEPLQRRGHPSYIQSDLASIYERAGRMHGYRGSLTQIPVVTVPNGDCTHPIPDLTHFLCDGLLWIDRQLHDKGVYPPIDVLSSMSRHLRRVTGYRFTREDHCYVQNQMRFNYYTGKDIKANRSFRGDESISQEDQLYLEYFDTFERQFLSQGPYEFRGVYKSLDLAWQHLRLFPKSYLTCFPWRIHEEYYCRPASNDD